MSGQAVDFVTRLPISDGQRMVALYGRNYKSSLDKKDGKEYSPFMRKDVPNGIFELNGSEPYQITVYRGESNGGEWFKDEGMKKLWASELYYGSNDTVVYLAEDTLRFIQEKMCVGAKGWDEMFEHKGRNWSGEAFNPVVSEICEKYGDDVCKWACAQCAIAELDAYCKLTRREKERNYSRLYRWCNNYMWYFSAEKKDDALFKFVFAGDKEQRRNDLEVLLPRMKFDEGLFRQSVKDFVEVLLPIQFFCMNYGVSVMETHGDRSRRGHDGDIGCMERFNKFVIDSAEKLIRMKNECLDDEEEDEE